MYHSSSTIKNPSDLPAAMLIFKKEQDAKVFLQNQYVDNSVAAARPVVTWFGGEKLRFQSAQASKSVRLKFFTFLYRLMFATQQSGLFIITWEAFLERIPDINFLLRSTCVLSIGDRISKCLWQKYYKDSGYHQARERLEPGHFYQTGESISFIPWEWPNHLIKIEWFHDTIEALWIKYKGQVARPINCIELVPPFDFPTGRRAKQILLSWIEQQLSRASSKKISRRISDKQLPEFWGPWSSILWEKMSSFLEIIPSFIPIFFEKNAKNEVEDFWTCLKREDQFFGEKSSLPRPDLVKQFISAKEVFSDLKKRTTYILLEKTNDVMQPILQFIQQSKSFEAWMRSRSFSLIDWPFLFKQTKFKDFCWIFCVGSEQDEQSLKQLFKNNNFHFEHISTKNVVAILDGYFPAKRYTLTDHDAKTIPKCGAICEKRQVIIVPASAWKGCNIVLNSDCFDKSKDLPPLISSEFVENFISLIPFQPGDYVAHEQYGIARFSGLEEMEIGDNHCEFCVLEYAEATKVYVPVFSIHKIHPYASSHQEGIELSRLNTKQWEKNCLKAKERAKDSAFILLKERAQQSLSKKKPIYGDREKEKIFFAQFGFQETPDQQKAIDAVFKDLESEIIMDRLICGEVGFGKTEVALRAAFRVACNQKQVMLLAPTTLLVKQHFDRFSKRFKNWPIQVAFLSRFCSDKQEAEVLNKIRSGEIKILIGTHKILSKKVEFHDLGLFILDEEHRFGVLQKEKIAALSSNVDRLTLTATPIPRTLSMAMHGLKSLSLINTCPAQRLAVQTIVAPKDEEQCFLAIQKELRQGGQVYYVNNRIGTHLEIAERLRRAFPKARVSFVHGKLSVQELEKRMFDYYHSAIDILVCSAIVETGIDVPNANTLIVEHADQFGLGQLHQLRGRVGRSERQAYAYFYYDPNLSNHANSMAQKRLEVLSKFSDFGAGFMLAEQDLEIRGAGDLLGEAQSGKKNFLGIGLYLKLVSQAVQDLNSESSSFSKTSICAIDLGEELGFSKGYIPIISERIQWYRRLSFIQTVDDFENLKQQLEKLYGALSHRSSIFLQGFLLQIQAGKAGMASITHESLTAHVAFLPSQSPDLKIILPLLSGGLPQAKGVRFHFAKDGHLCWTYPSGFCVEEKYNTIDCFIRFLNDPVPH